MEHATHSKETQPLIDARIFWKGEFVTSKRQRKDNGNETPYRIGKTYEGRIIYNGKT